jgi:hypothetical protein
MESTIPTAQEELTPGERRYLVHFGQAQSRGLTLAEYCRAQGLSAQSLYNISSQLRRKKNGSPTSCAVVASKPERARGFVAVRVAPAASSVMSGCRLHHRSGWMIECPDLPDASWLQALVQGGEHAAT